MNRFKEFLHVVKRHEKCNFWNLWLFGSGPFLAYFFRSDWSKNGPIQKSLYTKKFIFSCPSTMQRNFWNMFIMRPYFRNCFLELLPHCNLTYETLQKKSFDLIIFFNTGYIEITSTTQFSGTLIGLNYVCWVPNASTSINCHGLYLE